MKILNMVSLICGAEPVDAIIVVCNSAYAMANIMDAVLITENRPKTIVSAMVFEPNPSMMRFASLSGLVVPVFFNPDDEYRGLQGGRYMGTAVEFMKRVEANYT